jgi:hypothetical protein
MDIEQLIARYPRVYHMAEQGTWDSIRRRGLLSASAALDVCGISGDARAAYETHQRTSMMDVLPGRADGIVLRDQKPMPPKRLELALIDGTSPAEWYALINSKVFFWAQEHRLLTLLNARDYRNKEHDVLTVDSATLIRQHAERVRLCPMNSGNTWPVPHRRGAGIFQSITDYAARPSGAPSREVVEIVVEHSVPDIARHVTEVRRMKGSAVLSKIA